MPVDVFHAFSVLLSTLVVIVLVAAGTTAYDGGLPLKVYRAFARRYGLEIKDESLHGEVQGHAVEISWTSLLVTIVVKPAKHFAAEITFSPDTGEHRGVTDVMSAAIGSRYRWTGDEMRRATFASPPVRDALRSIGCSWNGEHLEASCVASDNVIVHTLQTLLTLASVMGSESVPEFQRAESVLALDPHPHVRDHVLNLMAVHFSDRFPEVARRALRDRDPSVRLLAMSLLGITECSPPPEAELLEVVKKGSPENGRRAAIRLLRLHGTADALRALAQLRNEPRFERDAELAMVSIQERCGFATGRVSLVAKPPSGQLSPIERGALSPPIEAKD